MGLSVGWDRRGRGGEAGGGGGVSARNSQHTSAPSPLSSTSPPVLYCVTLLRDLCWTARTTLALPSSAHVFLRLTLFQRFKSKHFPSSDCMFRVF